MARMPGKKPKGPWGPVAKASSTRKPLADREIEKEREWNAPELKALQEAYREGRLSLVLGAGISKACGVPMWEELTRSLLRSSLAGLYESVGPEEAPLHVRDIEATLKERVRPMIVRYVKAKLGERFLDEVRKALYQRPPRLSGTVREILAMQRLSAILTLNFDDLLETFAERLGAEDRYVSIFEAPIRVPLHRIPIYHTHGFLPADPSLRRSTGLIFSEDDYHERLHQPYHWTDHVFLDLLARTTCLFIGTSGEDPNLRRLIDLARTLAVPNRHFILLKPPAPLPADGRAAIRYSASRRAVWDAFEHLGLAVLWIHAYDRDIPAILRHIRLARPGKSPSRRSA